jgi:hypothetical protein
VPSPDHCFYWRLYRPGASLERGIGSSAYQRTKETIFLRGNHETFVHRFLSKPAVLDDWRLCGGLETLASYGLEPSINPNALERARLAKQLAMSMTKQDIEFLESLDLSFSCGDFLFVHAGIRPGVPLRKQREEDLLWIREEFLSCEQRFEKFVVHGHTPVDATDIRSNRINIDTGAFATGRLTCIVIEGTSIVELIDVPPVSALPETHRRGWSLLRRPVVTGASKAFSRLVRSSPCFGCQRVPGAVDYLSLKALSA